VTVNTAPTISISGTTTLCAGSSTSLTASGGSTYSWSGGPSTAVYSVSPVSNTTYTVTGTANGCTSSVSQLVTVNAAPTISISGTTTICAGSSTSLTASGGSTYAWSGGPSTVVYSVSPVSNTTYTVTGTANSCTSSVSQLVTVNALPTAPVITENASVLSSSAASFYQWYLNGGVISGATSQSYAPTVSGIYSVEITDANGCSAMSADFQFVFSGINEEIKEHLIQIIPNPGEGLFFIEMKVEDFISLQIMDGRGALVFSMDTYSNQLDLTKYAAGMYHCNILTSKGLIVKKLVISN
jgi:hypothetical protein